jgi:uncharacterized membrane protein
VEELSTVHLSGEFILHMRRRRQDHRRRTQEKQIKPASHELRFDLNY